MNNGAEIGKLTSCDYNKAIKRKTNKERKKGAIEGKGVDKGKGQS